ncbi:sensor domain-containing diguanylate cyclase [Dethiosulfovibrio salsuginis]|uniref:Diguanylate cyclase (GGDEF) domain-containing protein n=1 Tax=Dethiosulfovibrio salsuginis TaxID=561720 RepID=A0A1X7KJB3_9BACT|nr:GGDEF domain-containing protein [Dethiosulfovibrio salsuginis]SMG41156.1 diguanylate cyclase (GGDEF) domain-containing protein [Dethiosulfovibrio salsuginis]
MNNDIMLKALLENVSSCVFLLNDQIQVKEVNPSFESVFNTTMESVHDLLCGNAIRCSNALEEGVLCGRSSHCGDCELRKAFTEALTEGSSTTKKTLFMNVDVDGNRVERYFRFSVTPMDTDKGKSLVVVLDDFTDLKEAHLALERLATTDSLTGVANHGTVFTKLEEMCATSDHGGSPLSVFMADLDHFKKVNDTWGHKRGDQVLAIMAHTMAETVGSGGLVGRYGGEEFIAVLPGADLELATSTAEAVRENLEGTAFDIPELRCTASFGVAELRPGETATELVIRADQAMYQAKQQGRNRVIQAESPK